MGTGDERGVGGETCSLPLTGDAGCITVPFTTQTRADSGTDTGRLGDRPGTELALICGSSTGSRTQEPPVLWAGTKGKPQMFIIPLRLP